MEQNNPLFIAFQQGYARRNSNNFSRDWDEFKTNHADLFQPPSPAKPSVNGELLGFLEIEIEKANKNGKACNLKDGDLNRAQAWYSAAESFLIVKNKITELLNTPHGHESNIINCPSCNTVWDLSRYNSCQCGASLVTKASPVKAEQEGPPNWSNKANYSGDSYIGGYHWFHTLMGKVRDIGIYMQQHEVDSILRSFWGQQIRDIYADISEWFAYIYERESGKQMYQEQKGLRWVNLAENPPCVVEDWEDWHGYHMRYASDRVKLDLHLFEFRDGALCKIGGTGRLELSEVEWLDESTTPPVKEAGQPVDDKTFDENLAYEIIARFVANSGKKDSIKKIRKEAFVDGALWAKKYLVSRQQPAGDPHAPDLSVKCSTTGEPVETCRCGSDHK